MIIQTIRLILRPLEIKDIGQEYLDNLNNPKVNRFISASAKRQTYETIKKYIKNYKGKLLGIFLNIHLPVHIGNLSLYEGTVGIMIFKEYQGLGYANECLEAIKYLGYDKAGIDSRNIASLRAFKKAGFYIKEF